MLQEDNTRNDTFIDYVNTITTCKNQLRKTRSDHSGRSNIYRLITAIKIM